MTFEHYTSDWNSELMELKLEFASTVSGTVVRANHLKELLASLGNGANLEGQNNTGPSRESEIKSTEANESIGFEMRSPGVDDPAFDNSKIKTPGADTPATDI